VDRDLGLGIAQPLEVVAAVGHCDHVLGPLSPEPVKPGETLRGRF
jgi:hypothetical protein